MSRNYSDWEKDILRNMIKDIKWECSAHSDMDSEAFAWLIFKKVEWCIRQLLDARDNKAKTLMNGMLPDKRGKEECDCSKSMGNCGCRVRAFNDAIDEMEYRLKLAKQSLEEDEKEK